MCGCRPVEPALKVACLLQAATYPAGSGPIELLETHLSWVFLTATHAYKMKKPVCYGGLDLTTPAARRHNCLEEVRLNRRLAPGVYEGVSSLNLDPVGRLYLDGEGDPVDWLVRMRRLPAGRMLDRLIEGGCLSAASVQGVAEALARFYRAAAPVSISPRSYRRRFLKEVGHHHRALARPALGLPRGMAERVYEAQRAFLRIDARLLGRRAAQGRIVEGHGDLRPEHICLEERPVIFDCLEFSRRLRTVDPVDELAFLALECQRLGAPGVGPVLFARYCSLNADSPPPRLVAFYKSCRACLWAKLATWRLEEADPSRRSQWRERAGSYLRLAEKAIADAFS